MEGLAVYNPFRAQLIEFKEFNSKLVFDYEDPKGNKDARSHVYKLRQSKAAVEKARKEEKAASLEYGRRVDAEAKEIIAEIEAMIEVHQKHLDEIEQREQARIDGIKSRINAFVVATEGLESLDSGAIHERLTQVKGVALDDSFAEFLAEAGQVKDMATKKLEAAHALAMKREADAAELERLRKEAAEREQKERDERLQREAAERAKAEAEAKAQAEREALERKAREEKEAAEKRELELKLQAEKAEREKLEAEQRAEREKQEAIEAERLRIQREAEAKAAEEAKREADKKHQAKIHGEIIAALAVCGISEDAAKAAIVAIRKGEVPHVRIIY
jgi:colicin import membrane protein